MNYLLDANICIRLLGFGDRPLKERVLGRDLGELGVSAIAFAEVALGSWNGKAPSMLVLDAFARQIAVLPFDMLATRQYAMLPFMRGGFDRLIAAHVLSLGLVLVTDNERHFAGLPDLRVENWTL